ncbi:hypothetical protein [Rheinheimera oceanensis]|uniref:hypothetical protein n=1 Tax=Rheinheimera oceanensis TaxID=2817449 RepID=UPI001BFEA396|nr:hypothetical protein [Rheinheimera oceanensis]
MKRDQINNLIKSVNSKLIEPISFPEVRPAEGYTSFIMRKDDEYWMSQEVFEKTLVKLSNSVGCSRVIAAEDFERVYKSTGETVRLNETFGVSWEEFSRFCSKNAMISFYIFDDSQRWCAWFNDGYWVLVFDKQLSDHIDDIYLNVNTALQAFPEADEQFKIFIKHLYAAS